MGSWRARSGDDGRSGTRAERTKPADGPVDGYGPHGNTSELPASAASRAPDHVGFFLPSLSVGGAQRVTITLANALADRGYEVDLVVADADGGLASDVAAGVSVFELPPGRLPAVGVGAVVPALRSYLRRERPAVLFAAMTFASVVAILSTSLARTRTVVVPTEHDTFGVNPTPKERVTTALARHLYPRVDRAVAVSAGVAESVADGAGIDEERVPVLHNPVPVEEIRERAAAEPDHPWFDDPDTPVVLTVGRLAEQKDLGTLVRAFGRLHERRPDARLVIAGTGPERDSLEALVDRLGLDGAVSLPGFVDNQYALMRRADVFVLSSIHEGLPTALIEALACGCPVVSTDCPSGPREILADGTYGGLVPVGDDRALADAIEATLSDPPDADLLRRRADDYAVEAAVDAYEEFIAEVRSRDG